MVVPTVAYAADPVGDLKALGQRVLHDLDTRGGSLDAAPGEIVAIGGCVRPTASQRAALTAAITADAGTGVEDIAVAFGCVERTGVVVDVTFDRVDKGG